jgi:hypothetical protein
MSCFPPTSLGTVCPKFGSDQSTVERECDTEDDGGDTQPPLVLFPSVARVHPSVVSLYDFLNYAVNPSEVR